MRGWICCLVDSSSGAISRTREFDVTRFRSKAGDGYEHDNCSSGGNAVDDRRRGGWKDVSGFSSQAERGEEIWSIRCRPGGLSWLNRYQLNENGQDESGGEKRGARGVRQHFSFEFFLTTVI